jgi:hypothetical protein
MGTCDAGHTEAGDQPSFGGTSNQPVGECTVFLVIVKVEYGARLGWAAHLTALAMTRRTSAWW